MNDRIFKALERAGLPETPIASLDYEQQLFALTPQTLVFQAQDDGPLQQVALRDITRIHSDQTGTLRIEVGAQTAITASLLGYDAGRVQRFFQLVRDTTARAKQLPPAPAAGSPAPIFFGKPAPTIPLAEQLAAAPRPPQQGLAPLTPQPVQAPDAGSTIRIAAQIPATQGPTGPAATPEGVSMAAVAAPANETGPDSAAAARDAALLRKVRPAPSAELAPSEQPADQAVTRPERVHPAAELSPALRISQTHLLRRSRRVGALSGTARFLALVLVLGALGMGYVMWQKQSQHVPALWTVTIGIVTAVALLILAEVLRFLADLGAVMAEAEARP